MPPIAPVASTELGAGTMAAGTVAPIPRTTPHLVADLHLQTKQDTRLRQQLDTFARPSTTGDPMPPQIQSLAAALKVAQDSLPRALAAGQKLISNVNELTDATAQVEELSGQIAKHTAGVKALLGGLTNGGPPLEDDAAKLPPAPMLPKPGDA